MQSPTADFVVMVGVDIVDCERLPAKVFVVWIELSMYTDVSTFVVVADGVLPAKTPMKCKAL